MIPNDYDLWLQRNRGAMTESRPAPSAADVKRAEAVGAYESARHEVGRAYAALKAAGEDPTGTARLLVDLDRELTWLRG